MTQEEKREFAIWSYTLMREKVFPHFVSIGVFDKSSAKMYEGEMLKQINLFDIPGAHLSYIGEELIKPYKESYVPVYVSLTDLARQKDKNAPSYMVQSWLRDYETIEFLRLWEMQSNPEFDNNACNELIQLMKKTTFTLTPKQWITKTKAIGLRSKQGKGGGTLAHPDIAVEFHMWIDPKFRMDVVKNFRGNLLEGNGND